MVQQIPPLFQTPALKRLGIIMMWLLLDLLILALAALLLPLVTLLNATALFGTKLTR